jgi:hypothetical protein
LYSLMASLFHESDEEGNAGGASPSSRAPAKSAPKVRPFKRPPNMAPPPEPQPAAFGDPSAPYSQDNGGAVLPPPPSSVPPSEISGQASFAASHGQGSYVPSGGSPAGQQRNTAPPEAAPAYQQHHQQQQVQPSPYVATVPQSANAFTNFLQQPLGDIGSPNPIPPHQAPYHAQYQQGQSMQQGQAMNFGAPPPHNNFFPQPQHHQQQYQQQQQQQQYGSAGSVDANRDWMSQGPNGQQLQQQSQPQQQYMQPNGALDGALVPSDSMQRGPTVERELLPPAPSMSASPRRSMSMKALPQVRMTHTALGQVQLPAMPPVNLPNAPDQPRANSEADTAAWTAFTDLRKQLEESHSRTLALHTDISRMQIAHEKEAAALQNSVAAQVQAQSRELQEMTDNYNSATAKLDQLSGLLGRKAEELMKAEQKLHNADLSVVAMQQKVAHVEDRVKLSDQARQVAEVRTRELELSLEHATNLIQSLRRQLSVANDEKNNALTEQYNTFEANRQQLIVFYAEREQFMLGNYAQSLSNVQLSMQQYLHEREAEVEKKWEETFRTQLEHQKSLHTELVARADRHVEEMTKLKAEQEAEKEKAIAHMQREIMLVDQRSQERAKNNVEDISRREMELGEREQKMRMGVAQAEQDAKLALLSKEAEMKAQYDRLLEEARREYEKDRERLSIAYREQIAALAGQHLANERELERLHREKEREMAQRYRVSNWDDDDRRTTQDSHFATSRTQDVLLAKMDKLQADQEARRLAARAKFAGTTGADGGSGAAGTGALAAKVVGSSSPPSS